MKSSPTTDTSLAPDILSIHPALADFPGLSDDQLAALTLSIQEHGIQSPLVVDADHQVYDGRARLGIALALGLSSVPVTMRPEENVLGYALESAVNRRQLTRSAVSLLLFEQHPDLAASRGGRAGRPKKLAGNQPISGEALNSFRDLAVRYRVPREHFGYLAEMKAEATAAEWTAIRHAVLFEEASLPRQYAGFKTGLKAGSKRGPVVYAALDAQGFLEGILPTAFASIRQGFARWHTSDIRTDAKAAIEREWAELLDDAPPELLRIAQRKARHV